MLARHCRENYLYSTRKPPAELTELLTEAARDRGPNAHSAPGLPRCSTRRSGDKAAADTVLRLAAKPSGSGIPVAVLGGGDYTRSEIIPALRRGRFSLYAIANREPQIAALVGREYGFVLATTDSERAIAELPAPGLVIVATAHDSHARLACAAVKAGHRVFLEKPPTVTVGGRASARGDDAGQSGCDRDRIQPAVSPAGPQGARSARKGVWADFHLLRLSRN